MQTKAWVAIVFVFILLATIIQIGGLVSPLWIYLHKDDITVGVGLYYRIGCGADTGNNCSEPSLNQLPFGYNSTATYDKDSWEAIVWLETISASVGVILSVLMLIYLIGFSIWKKMGTLNVVMAFVAVLTWLPLGVGLIIYIIYHTRVITRSNETSPESFPWSPVMCLFAGVMFVILNVLIRTRCRHRNYMKNAIPTSTDSKLALNPSTKNFLMKRYYTPSPYHEDRRQALYSSSYFNDKSHLLGNGTAVGAINNVGNINPAITNNYVRAIEYSTPAVTQDVSVVRTIQTNNLPPGTFVGNGAATNVGNETFSGTIYEQNLSTYVSKNETSNKSGNVYTDQRTNQIGNNYIDQRTNHMGNTYTEQRTSPPNYQSEVRGVNRQSYSQNQWAGVTSQEVDRFQENLLANSTTLNRERGYEEFSDIDAQTVYYTGKEGFRPITLNRTDASTSQERIISTKGGSQANGYVVTREIRQPLQPVQEEQIVNNITVIERSTGRMEEPNRHFRISADQNVITGIQRSKDYTIHTRTFTENDSGPQLILMPGYLSGRKHPYNGKYIYRPYSESSY